MRNISILFPIIMIIFLCGCSQRESNSVTIISSDYSSTDEATDSQNSYNNEPICLVPTASGEAVSENKYGCVDMSNAHEGYIMVKYTGSNPKVKLQIIGPDNVCYTYNLKTTDYEAFPLSSSDGKYKISIYENISATKYTAVLTCTLDVHISHIFGPNLYPNQYCNFTKDSQVVKKAVDITASCSSDLEKVTSIYDYVTSNIVYDHDKAANVESGYISDVDEILFSNKGICLDYAAVMTSMLRSQRIPTRLEVGYAGSAYHAWISTYIKDVGWVNGIIQFDGTNWSLMDPTFAASSDTETLKSFIGTGTNYKTKYIY